MFKKLSEFNSFLQKLLTENDRIDQKILKNLLQRLFPYDTLSQNKEFHHFSTEQIA